MKRTSATRGKDLSVELAGVRLRTPLGVGSIGGPAVRSEALTPDLYADIFLKHIAAGAGYICLPSTAHVPEALLSDLEKRARQPALQNPTVRPLMFFKGQGEGFDPCAPARWVSSQTNGRGLCEDDFGPHPEAEAAETEGHPPYRQCQRTRVLCRDVRGRSKGPRGGGC